VALKAMKIVDGDRIIENVRKVGAAFTADLRALAEQFPDTVGGVRGYGFMLGLELKPGSPIFADGPAPSLQLVNRLLGEGLVTVPAGNEVLRFLPPLNLSSAEAGIAADILRKTIAGLHR
jgi:4-aminobutyrate aminotransferase-like enzyme